MTSTVVVETNQHPEPRLVVFGRDGAGKPRASWFDAQSADLARKAAEQMKMCVLPIETEEQKAVARELRPGRVLENGRAFTPFARASVFGKLVEFANAANGDAGEESIAQANNGLDASTHVSEGDPCGGATDAPKWPRDIDQIGIGSVCWPRQTTRTAGGKASWSVRMGKP